MNPIQEKIQPVFIQHHTDSVQASVEDLVSVEEPLEIKIVSAEGVSPVTVAITMRTPGDDEELALGFLFTEGLIHNIANVSAIYSEELNSIVVEVFEFPDLDKLKIERNFYTSSSCGICGKTSIDSIKLNLPSTKVTTDFELKKTDLFLSKERLLKLQENFNQTGGLHAACLLDSAAGILELKEDVGRHNALDKLIGKSFFNKEIPLNKCGLLLSGRISFELVQKAAMAGLPLIAAFGAPSSLAVQAAEDFNITLVGFLKPQSFNVYTHSHRILTQ